MFFHVILIIRKILKKVPGKTRNNTNSLLNQNIRKKGNFGFLIKKEIQFIGPLL